MFAYLYNLSQFIANLYFSSTYLFQTGVLTRQTFEVIDFQYNLDPQVGTYYKYTYILYVFYTVHKYILYSSIGIHAESHGILNDKYISFDVGRYLIGHVVGFECHLRLVNLVFSFFWTKALQEDLLTCAVHLSNSSTGPYTYCQAYVQQTKSNCKNSHEY